MTQKSLGRQRRDEAAAKVKQQGVHSPYKDLDDQFAIHVGLFKPYMDMAAIIENPEVAPFFPNIEHVHNLTRTLKADVIDVKRRTEALQAKHAGKTAMPDMINEDENFEIIMMFQEYQMLFNVHQQTIIPVMLELDEHLAVALKAKGLAEAEAIAAATAGTAVQQPATV